MNPAPLSTPTCQAVEYEPRLVTAVHEVGHAVACCLTPFYGLVSVSLEHRRTRCGRNSSGDRWLDAGFAIREALSGQAWQYAWWASIPEERERMLAAADPLPELVGGDESVRLTLAGLLYFIEKGRHETDVSNAKREALGVTSSAFEATKLVEGVARQTALFVNAPRFRALARALTDELYERGELDGPEALELLGTVELDAPSFYYRLGEDAGTKVVSHVRKTKRRTVTSLGAHVSTTKHRRATRKTRAEVEGVSGPSGTYKNLPTLGVPGLILGDSDTAVLFDRTLNQYAQIPVDASEAIDRNRLTLECWVKPTTVSNDQGLIGGPTNSSGGHSVWSMWITSAGTPRFRFLHGGALRTQDGSASLSAGSVYHLAMTWNGTVGRIYVNGVLDDEEEADGALTAPDSDFFIYIGRAKFNGTFQYADAVIDEVAIYEKALTPERIAAHYEAGANRGFPEQLTGTRIAAAASSPLWSTAGIEAGAFVMQPTMQFGQGKLDVVLEAVSAERPRAMFYFGGSGDPIYRDFDSLDGASNDLTLGDAPGEIGYTGIDLVYDNEVFNTVTGSTDGGAAITVTDAQSVSDRKPRTRDAESSLPLRDDDDVRTILNTIVNEWSRPAMRPAAVATVGKDPDRVAHILGREIGDRVRVRRRGEGGTPIDRQTFILGYRKRLDRNRILSCTWNLARGFNAADGAWHLGVPGFSELDSTAVLG